MSIWTHLTGVVHLNDGLCEDQVLACYERISHLLRGSEGGPNISFTRTARKNFSTSAERDYRVEPFTRLDNMVIQGDLRSFDSEKAAEAVEGIKDFLRLLKNHNMLRHASFVLQSDDAQYYYNIAYVKGKVRHQKMEVKY